METMVGKIKVSLDERNATVKMVCPDGAELRRTGVEVVLAFAILVALQAKAK